MTDEFSAYETGLTKLLERLGKNHPCYAEALTLQSRLLENIAQARRYNDTETRRAERAQIMSALNGLALEATERSFNDWCGLTPSENTVSDVTLETRTKRVQLLLEGDFTEFNRTRQQDLVNVLAALLAIEGSSIRILKVHASSILVTLEMPELAANRLHTMAANQDFRLKRLGIISVKVEHSPMISLRTARRYPVRNRRLVFAFILSALLSLLVGLPSNLTATYLAPSLAGQTWLVYGALIVTFVIALPVSAYLFLRSLPEAEAPTEDAVPPLVVPQPPTQRANAVSQPASQLPGKSYRELVGRDALVGEVMAALRDPAGKWIVAIDGMGGIGKTALAREVADRCLSERLFDVAVWEQAPKEQFGGKDRRKGIGTLTFETALDSIARQLGALDVPRLKGAEKEARVRALLQAQRVLVVLDNLETAKEPQNEIARRLGPYLDPSKALLTSRHRFKGDLYAIHLPGLDEDGALRFIRWEAEEKGIDRVAKAEPGELKEVAQSTGGSPLALKLVVGQLGHLPLETVLGQLRDVRLPEGETDEDDYIRFYKGIFFPSWGLLSDDGKKLLISMAHFAPGVGGTPEAIKATSDLSDDVLRRTIDELWRLSFLEVGESPSLKQVRYYLHALTQYFVLSDIVQIRD